MKNKLIKKQKPVSQKLLKISWREWNEAADIAARAADACRELTLEIKTEMESTDRQILALTQWREHLKEIETIAAKAAVARETAWSAFVSSRDLHTK